MPGSGYRVRVAAVAAVLVVVVVSATAPFGVEAARAVTAILEVVSSAVAVFCGMDAARRVAGVDRLWRLLAVGSVASLLVGQSVLWTRTDVPPPAYYVPYWLFQGLALAAVLTLAAAGGVLPWRGRGAARQAAGLTLFDGVVVSVAYGIFVLIGGLGISSAGSYPRTGGPVVHVLYATTGLVVVVVTSVLAMVYGPGHPGRVNFLQLACGAVLITAADRTVAYFESIDVTHGAIWGATGLIVGPVFVALAVRDRPAVPVTGDRMPPLYWAQVVLPYSGVVGIAVFEAFHLLSGHRLSPAVLVLTVVVAVLVTVRQVIAVSAQWRLTRRLYDAQQRLAHQVLHDSMTGLPNRLMLSQRLDEAVRDGPFMLVFVDLDDFKDVNDQFGHLAGDALLRAVGVRLSECLDGTDLLARIGGDEFAVLVGDTDMSPEAVAEVMRTCLREPFPVNGSSVVVRASMGVVQRGAEESATSLDDLLRQADVAMYAGKRLGKDTAVIYEPAAGVVVDFSTSLRRSAGESPPGFSLVYQPVTRLPEGDVVAVEALARWVAPTGVMISPETFVSQAEAAGMGAALDLLVLDIACREVAERGLDVDVHVNIGAARMGNTAFESQVLDVLARRSVKPEQLVLEITETVPIVDLAGAASQITRFNERGVQVALDDFGAGYNSLKYLHVLPVQIVKLDRSLAVGAEPDRIAALYRSVVGLCDDLGFRVIAEGIESREQAAAVVAAGCRLVQGNLYGLPMPIDDVVATVATRE